MRKSSKLFNICIVCLMSILILSALGAGQAYAKWVNYSFVNHSGRTIKNLYITSTGYDSWGKDLLGSSVLSNGESVGLRYNNNVRYFDLKVVFMDNDYVTFSRYDYRSIWRVTIYRSGSNRYTIQGN